MLEKLLQGDETLSNAAPRFPRLGGALPPSAGLTLRTKVHVVDVKYPGTS